MSERRSSFLSFPARGSVLMGLGEWLCKRQTLASLIVLAVPNLVTWALLLPGYFQADHQARIAQFLSGEPSLWHSMVWTVASFPFLCLGPSYALYGLFQIALFVASVYFSVRRLVRLGILKGMVALSALFGFFPSFLLFNQLYSSDMCFASLMILLTSMCIEISESKGECLRDNRFCLRVAVVCFLVLSLRKNALLVGIGLCVIPVVFRPVWRRAIVTFLGALIVAVGLDASLPILVGAKPSPSQEMLSVPSLQIAATYAAGGDIPESADRFFTSIRSAEEWSAAYVPGTADYAKRDVKLSTEFVVHWIETGIRNPGTFVSSYVQLEYPFWSLVDTSENYLSTDFGCHDEFTHAFIAAGHDSYESQFGGLDEKSVLWKKPMSLQGMVDSFRIPVLGDVFYILLFNRGLPFWVVLAGAVTSARGKRRNFLIASLPVACVILSLLMFAPMPLIRYAMQAYYSLPLLVAYYARRTSAFTVRMVARAT